jgi:hypothetical protein
MWNPTWHVPRLRKPLNTHLSRLATLPKENSIVGGLALNVVIVQEQAFTPAAQKTWFHLAKFSSDDSQLVET